MREADFAVIMWPVINFLSFGRILNSNPEGAYLPKTIKAMANQFSDDQNQKRLLAFKQFLAKIKEEHPGELRDLKAGELAMFEIQNNVPTLRIHGKINAAIRKIIHAKWVELFPA